MEITNLIIKESREKMPCFGSYKEGNINCCICARIERVSHGTNRAWDDTYSYCKEVSSRYNNTLFKLFEV